MKLPPLHLEDGYKTDHKSQYPANTLKVYSNLTARKSRVPGQDSIIFFGLNYFIKEILLGEFEKEFFDKPKEGVIAKYKRRLDNYLPGNRITYDHISDLHDLQYLPLTIKALPEGALVKCNVPVLTITNTLPQFFWLPNFLETILSCEVWPMSTSATTAFNYRLIFDKFALETTGSTEFSSSFQAHDFSFRGQMGRHAAAMNGAAHLTSFKGTDTIPAIDFLEQYYSADSDRELVGASVPATEHSVMCMGMKDGELETFKRLISETYPDGFVSIVSDTWDFWNVVRPKSGILATLRDVVLARQGRVVIRPDSGDPVKIICGISIPTAGSIQEAIDSIEDHIRSTQVHGETDYADFDKIYYIDDRYYQFEEDVEWNRYDKQYYFIENISVTYKEVPLSVEQKGAIQCLWEEFGGTTNEQGFRDLDSHVGLIYGDSITLERAREICQRLQDKGFSSTNWVAGVGSYSYQYVTRDTYGWAVKATYGELGHPITNVEDRDGVYFGIDDKGEEIIIDKDENVSWERDFSNIHVIEPREIFKDPITDRDPITGVSIKKSAKGLLQVNIDTEHNYSLTDQVSDEEEARGELKVVFRDGELLIDPTLSEIRERVNANVLNKLSPKPVELV